MVPALCAGSWLISWGGMGDREADTAQLAGARAWHSLWCVHREQPVWHDMAQHGMALDSTAWHGTARHGTAWHGMAQYGTLEHCTTTTTQGPLWQSPCSWRHWQLSWHRRDQLCHQGLLLCGQCTLAQSVCYTRSERNGKAQGLFRINICG